MPYSFGKYKEKLNHLGNMIESDNSMKIDISMKRAKFIGKVNSLNQEFYFAFPEKKPGSMKFIAVTFTVAQYGISLVFTVINCTKVSM